MTYCGIDCCKECSRLAECGGCEKCKGHPFGGSCVAERNKNFSDLKKSLISEINALEIGGLKVNDLFLLSGAFVNNFTKAPWYDDWSDKQQLDLYIIDLIGNVNSITLGFFDNDELMDLSMGYIKHWFRGTEYIINELCVKTEAQGRGIGSDFLHQMEEYLLA